MSLSSEAVREKGAGRGGVGLHGEPPCEYGGGAALKGKGQPLGPGTAQGREGHGGWA